MTFKLDNRTYTIWPVSFSVATDGGGKVAQSFDAHLANLPQERIDELSRLLIENANAYRRAQDYGEALPEDAGRVIREVAAEVLVGWDGIEGDDGEPVPFTPSTKAQVLSRGAVALAICGAWSEMVSPEGKPEPGSKGSGKSRAPGSLQAARGLGT